MTNSAAETAGENTMTNADLTALADELRDSYPAIDVTTVAFSNDFAGVGCCVIPQERVLAIETALRAAAGGPHQSAPAAEMAKPIFPRSWPDPTPDMLGGNPLFDAIWSVIRTWSINVPHVYGGYCGATGNHVRAIYDAISALPPPDPAEAGGDAPKPIAWAVFTDNGNCRIWFSDHEMAQNWARHPDPAEAGGEGLYWAKAYEMADELALHLSTHPVATLPPTPAADAVRASDLQIELEDEAKKEAAKLASVRAQTIEECARLAECFYNVDHGSPEAKEVGSLVGLHIASAIRSLSPATGEG